jgi:DNA-binding LytR/AlgR family response regulator
MRIAIIDDEKPARSELKYLITKVCEQAQIVECESGEDALSLINEVPFDLLCIDINLGDINGTVLAATIKKIQPEAEIVFATAYNNYAEKAFEVDALYYLLKPFSEDKVRRMMNKYNSKQSARKMETIENLEESLNLEDNLITENRSETSNRNSLSKISLNLDKKIVLVDISSIIYIESQNRACIIHTKEKEYKDTSTLNYFEEKLSDKNFFRIQKSFLINLNYVLEIYPWFNKMYCVKMEGYENEIITIGRTQIKGLKKILDF